MAKTGKKDKMDKRLTVFTPTYNRAYSLPQVYESLCSQTSKDFVWLVVDDGSTDNTRELMERWQAEGRVDIDYHYQQNAGKARAHNAGARLCHTELFVCLDSDDYLASPEVIHDTLSFWDDNADVASLPTTSGMVSYKQIVNRQRGNFPPGVKLTSLSKLNESYRGETTLMFKTDVLRKYPFPVPEGEKFMTEAYAYNQMDQHYQLLVFPYDSQTCEYRDDGITSNGWDVLFKNPKSYRMYYNQCIELNMGSKVYNMRMYIACSKLAADGKTFSSSSSKLLLLALYPLGIYQYYKLRRRKW